MGMWASGCVAFGIDLGDSAKELFYIETLNENGEAEDYTDGDIANIFQQWCAFQEGVKHPSHFNMDSKEWIDYREAANKFLEKYPFDIKTYCAYSSESSRYFLYLDKTKQNVDQYEAFPVTTYAIDGSIFKEFSDKFSLNLGDPQWSMMVIYG